MNRNTKNSPPKTPLYREETGKNSVKDTSVYITRNDITHTKNLLSLLDTYWLYMGLCKVSISLSSRSVFDLLTMIFKKLMKILSIINAEINDKIV